VTNTRVEQAVARQLGPLRDALRACEEQRRLRDILGGLGYIVGLAGLGLWWRSRRRRQQP
jgi:nickel transport protein